MFACWALAIHGFGNVSEEHIYLHGGYSYGSEYYIIKGSNDWDQSDNRGELLSVI